MIRNNIKVADVIKEIEMKEKTALEEKYHIFFAKDGYYKVCIPDESKKQKRRIVKRRKKEDLLDYLYKHEYSEEEQKPKYTLRNLYPKWKEDKAMSKTAASSLARWDSDWKRFYLKEDIIDKDIRNFTIGEIRSWVNKMINNHDMTSKCYYNMISIFKQILEYAKEYEIIERNLLYEIRIPKKQFAEKKKKDNSELFYSEIEEKQILELAWNDYKTTGNNACLAICLAFNTGVRAGELISLEWSNVMDDEIYICQMITKEYEKDNDGNYKYSGYTLKDHTKTDAGTRKIPLTKSAQGIIREIKKSNMKNGLLDSSFVFPKESKENNHPLCISQRSVNYRLEKYCNELGISTKRLHSIRRTFSTHIVNSDMEVAMKTYIMGHEKYDTTLKSYNGITKSNEIVKNQIEKALSF